MQFSTTTIAAIIAVLSPVVSATVFTGKLTLPSGDKQNVAWTNEARNPCTEATKIGSGGGSGCGETFSAGGIGGFVLIGCGGPGLTLEKDGEFNSNCIFDKKQIGGCPDNGSELEQSFNCF